MITGRSFRPHRALFVPALPCRPAPGMTCACGWTSPIQNGNNPPPDCGNPLDQLILGDSRDWAALRAVQFRSRPAHADQLHVDIWHKGVNIALDPGTFRYNAPPPWENGLAGTSVHNTLTINGQDQMTRAGKFLWLDWAQAQVERCSPQEISAHHNGYRHLGLLHHRSLRPGDHGGWGHRRRDPAVARGPLKTARSWSIGSCRIGLSSKTRTASP